MYKFEQTYDNTKTTVELNEPDATAGKVVQAFFDFMIACGFEKVTLERAFSEYGEENE